MLQINHERMKLVTFTTEESKGSSLVMAKDEQR